MRRKCEAVIARGDYTRYWTPQTSILYDDFWLCFVLIMMLINFVGIALFAMPINYTIFADFFLYVKNIEHQTLVLFHLLTSIYEYKNVYIKWFQVGVWNFSSILQNVCLDQLKVFCLSNIICLFFSLKLNNYKRCYNESDDNITHTSDKPHHKWHCGNLENLHRFTFQRVLSRIHLDYKRFNKKYLTVRKVQKFKIEIIERGEISHIQHSALS